MINNEDISDDIAKIILNTLINDYPHVDTHLFHGMASSVITCTINGRQPLYIQHVFDQDKVKVHIYSNAEDIERYFSLSNENFVREIIKCINEQLTPMVTLNG